jgi:vacuolar-type H+-ATPase subunit I/STV1
LFIERTKMTSNWKIIFSKYMYLCIYLSIYIYIYALIHAYTYLCLLKIICLMPLIPGIWEAELRSIIWGQSGPKASETLSQQISRERWHTPVVSAMLEAKYKIVVWDSLWVKNMKLYPKSNKAKKAGGLGLWLRW